MGQPQTEIDLSTFETYLKRIAFEPNDPYIVSYPAIIEWYKSADWSNNRSFLLAAALVYSWMPTVLKLSPATAATTESKLGGIIANLKTAKTLPREGLLSIADRFSGSIIAASKFAHFLNPEIYPIWDSRIALLLLKRRHYYIVNNIDTYGAYFETCHRLAESIFADAAKEKIENMINSYQITRIRAVELTLFCYSKGNLTV